jgi:ketosteroid isomerase-like protein
MTASGGPVPHDQQALVSRLLAAVGAGDDGAVRELLTDDYVLVEPASLPWGGDHVGPDGYLAAMRAITDRFTLAFNVKRLVRLPDGDQVVLLVEVTFTRRAHPVHSVVLPITEWFTIRDGRIARSEVHLSDTALLLTLLRA